jgi:hypothetical protein
MGYSKSTKWQLLRSFYGIFVPTFTDFYQVYRLLQAFIEFFDFKNVFCYCSYFLNLLSFTDFYHYAPKFMSFLYRLPINRLP